MSAACPLIDTLIVPCIGDSNNGSGEAFDATYDTSVAGIYQLKHDFTVVQAQDPLDQRSMSSIGSIVKTCQLLLSNGHVWPHVTRVVILPCAWAGTGATIASGGYWNVGGVRYALDGGSGLTHGYYAMVNQAKSLYPNSKIWFHDVSLGTNDGGAAAGVLSTALQNLVSEIRGIYADASSPFLFLGVPPDRINLLLGGQTIFTNVVSDLQNIGSHISNSYYIDPTGAASYFDNGWVHFNAATHRGGVENFNTAANNLDGTPHVWSAAANYTYAGVSGVQTTVVASDNYIYSCRQNNTNVNPAGNLNPTFWTQIRQVGRTIDVTNSLAYKKYQALLTAGF